MHVNHTSRRPVRFQPVSPSRSAQTCIENNSTNNKTPYKKNSEANFHQSRLANLGSRKGALVTQSAALSYPTDQLELKQQSCKEGSIELSPPPSSHGFERKRKHASECPARTPQQSAASFTPETICNYELFLAVFSYLFLFFPLLLISFVLFTPGL